MVRPSLSHFFPLRSYFLRRMFRHGLGVWLKPEVYWGPARDALHGTANKLYRHAVLNRVFHFELRSWVR